jgi:hypothetical protein
MKDCGLDTSGSVWGLVAGSCEPPGSVKDRFLNG